MMPPIGLDESYYPIQTCLISKPLMSTAGKQQSLPFCLSVKNGAAMQTQRSGLQTQQGMERVGQLKELY